MGISLRRWTSHEFLFKISLVGVVFATLGGTFTAVYQSFKEFRTQALLSIGEVPAKSC